MPLTPSLGTCQAEILMPTSFLPLPNQLVFSIGITPITGVLPNASSNVVNFNTLIQSDPTYQNWVTSSGGGSIFATVFDFQGMHVLVTVPSTTQITDNAIATLIFPNIPDTLVFDAPFTCNLAPNPPKPKPRKRGGALNDAFAMLPSVQCFQRQRDVNGNLLPCPDNLKLFGGANYVLDPNNSDDKKCCYRKTNPSA